MEETEKKCIYINLRNLVTTPKTPSPLRNTGKTRPPQSDRPLLRPHEFHADSAEQAASRVVRVRGPSGGMERPPFSHRARRSATGGQPRRTPGVHASSGESEEGSLLSSYYILIPFNVTVLGVVISFSHIFRLWFHVLIPSLMMLMLPLDAPSFVVCSFHPIRRIRVCRIFRLNVMLSYSCSVSLMGDQ